MSDVPLPRLMFRRPSMMPFATVTLTINFHHLDSDLVNRGSDELVIDRGPARSGPDFLIRPANSGQAAGPCWQPASRWSGSRIQQVRLFPSLSGQYWLALVARVANCEAGFRGKIHVPITPSHRGRMCRPLNCWAIRAVFLCCSWPKCGSAFLYGMRALLIFYLTQHFEFSDGDATQILRRLYVAGLCLLDPGRFSGRSGAWPMAVG